MQPWICTLLTLFENGGQRKVAVNVQRQASARARGEFAIATVPPAVVRTRQGENCKLCWLRAADTYPSALADTRMAQHMSALSLAPCTSLAIVWSPIVCRAMCSAPRN